MDRRNAPAPARLPALVLLVATALLAGAAFAACTGAVGSAGPVPTAAPGEPTPAATASTPATAPATAAPTAEPTAEPTETPTETPAEPTETPAETPAPTATAAAPTPVPTPTPATGATRVTVYFLMPDEDGGDPHLVAVERTIDATRAVARSAIAELLKGPGANEAGISTAIPAGTRLLGITIADRTATVDLSGTFQSGGGTFSMLGRLAQLTYTVTQFPTVDRVMLRLDGQPVEAIGGEGIIVADGLNRDDFADYRPAMLVESPAFNGALRNGGRVTGIANVFEAQFVLRLLDQRGRTLVDTPVMATCGTGCWGTFDVTLRYRVSAGQWGSLVVFEPSAKDGTPTGVRTYRVWLTP